MVLCGLRGGNATEPPEPPDVDLAGHRQHFLNHVPKAVRRRIFPLKPAAFSSSQRNLPPLAGSEGRPCRSRHGRIGRKPPSRCPESAPFRIVLAPPCRLEDQTRHLRPLRPYRQPALLGGNQNEARFSMEKQGRFPDRLQGQLAGREPRPVEFLLEMFGRAGSRWAMNANARSRTGANTPAPQPRFMTRMQIWRIRSRLSPYLRLMSSRVRLPSPSHP